MLASKYTYSKRLTTLLIGLMELLQIADSLGLNNTRSLLKL